MKNINLIVTLGCMEFCGATCMPQIVQCLLWGWSIKIEGRRPEGTESGLPKEYCRLINGGFADYADGVVSKNWKTSYWKGQKNANCNNQQRKIVEKD